MRSPLTIELSQEELEMIDGWYNAAAGESATTRDEAMYRLLEKLGIEAHRADLATHPLSEVIKEAQPKRQAQNKAIVAYIERHPDRKDEFRDYATECDPPYGTGTF